MRHTVIYKKLRLRNFLAVGNYWLEIDLSTHPTQMFLGENGGGKSTFMDALCYVLFGKSFRSINLPQLVNVITGGELLVELEFSVKGLDYMVRRGMKPDVFQIWKSGVLIDQGTSKKEYQEYLEALVRRSYKTFTQTVIIGTANYTPFMKLQAAARREVVENLLDIEIFTEMNKLLKGRKDALDAAIRTKVQEAHFARLSYQAKKTIKDERLAATAEAIASKEAKYLETAERIAKLDTEIDESKVIVDKISAKVAAVKKKVASGEKYQKLLDKVDVKVKKLDQEAQFYVDHDVCPKCHQSIDADFRAKTIVSLENTMTELEAGKTEILDEILKLGETSQELEALLAAQQEATKYGWGKMTERETLDRLKNELWVEIQSMRVKSLEKDVGEEEMKRLEDTVKAYDAEVASMDKDMEAMQMAAAMLKDGGIKTKIIRQYIPIMNQLINKYLEELDLFVGFSFDENFNEKMMSRYRDNFSYGSFSEGQKSKINLAILFAWLELIQLRNATSCNLLILDEVLDGSLDDNAMEDALKLFEKSASARNIIVITHKKQFAERFDKVRNFKLVKNFTQMTTEGA